jgi:FMN phosphatase YigB (HAD superfamily)
MTPSKLVFIDVDGVLLDYEGPWVEFWRSKGYTVPENFRDRKNYHFSASFPDMTDKATESLMVDEFGLKGGLRDLKPFPSIDTKAIGAILSHPNVFVLSTFKEAFRPDRIRSLEMQYDAQFIARKILGAHAQKKGEVMREVAQRLGVPMENCYLIDDVGYNIGSAEEYGGKGLLVDHPYNKSETKQRTTHETLAQDIARLVFG